jgi:hypothetical protein
LNKINEICARMVTDPGEDMKNAQVVKGVIDDFYSFAHKKPESDFCASMIDQATQTADMARRDLGLGILKCLKSIRQERIL